MTESSVSWETELNTEIESAINSIEGSGWAFYKYNKISIVSHTNETARAGIYIYIYIKKKTPETIIILHAH